MGLYRVTLDQKFAYAKAVKEGGRIPVVIDGDIDRITAKAIHIVGHAAVDQPMHCSKCGRALRHPVSKLVGVGPHCAREWGITHRYSMELSKEDLDTLRAAFRDVTVDMWVPRSTIVSTQQEGQDVPLPTYVQEKKVTDIEVSFPARTVGLREGNVQEAVLTCEYNPSFLHIIRGMQGRTWDGPKKEWVLPICPANLAGFRFFYQQKFTFSDAVLSALQKISPRTHPPAPLQGGRGAGEEVVPTPISALSSLQALRALRVVEMVEG